VALSASLLVADGDVSAGDDCTPRVNDGAADGASDNLGVRDDCRNEEYEKDNDAFKH